MKQLQPVQCPRFDVKKFSARGETEMQYSLWLERFVELFEFSRGLGVIDWHYGEFALDAVFEALLLITQGNEVRTRRMPAHLMAAADIGRGVKIAYRFSGSVVVLKKNNPTIAAVFCTPPVLLDLFVYNDRCAFTRRRR